MKKFLSFVLAVVMLFTIPVFSAEFFREITLISSAASNTPAKVTALKASSVRMTNLKLSWSKVSGATGYRVYKYSSSSKKYTKLATVSSASFTVKDLKHSTTYKFAVDAYKKVNGKVYSGKKSDLLSVKTKVKSLEPTSSDKKLLLKILDESGMAAYTKLNYDYSSSDALKKAQGYLFGGWPGIYLFEYLFRYYGWTNSCKYYNAQSWDSNDNCIYSTPDPLHRIKKHYTYLKVDATKMDWLLKNVFCVKPVHQVGYKGAWGSESYYYKGYYYLATGDGGDYYGENKISSYTLQSTGTYKFAIKNSSGGYYPDKKYSVTARMKKVDGKRVWTIYKIG